MGPLANEPYTNREKINMPIYSYAELKGKIKVGDKVRAVVGKTNACWNKLLNDGSNTEKITHVDSRGFSINGCYHGYHSYYFLELLTEEKTLDTVDVGDVVVDKRGEERTVLDTSKNGRVLFLSILNYPTYYSTGYTRQELKDKGYTVKQSTPAPEPKEMTLDEVSKALGYPVRIKE